MKFPRPKKLVFCNNKGGVGKTTLAFNCATIFAKKGYKTALIDLDPQCNLTLSTLSPEYYETTLLSPTQKDIYDVLKPKMEGSGDIDLSVPLTQKDENLFILPGSLRLSVFENLLANGYNDAAAGNLRGYSDTSSIDRYLQHRGAEDQIDIFVIDTSPSLGMLNRVTFLGADYFVVPMMPDSFNVQGIENLGTVFEQWKKNWKNTAVAVAGSTPKNQVLSGESLFIGYIINSFNVYSQRVVHRQQDWLTKIPERVKMYLSEKHCRHGLVEKSWKNPLASLQDYGQLTAISMEKSIAIPNLKPGDIKELNLEGTKQLYEKSIEQFDELSEHILKVLEAY